jgi:signal transduction histidine kinase/CheY-like chemotaxis protein/HPt (histidine-containing phosphotransfer) domain-containing protein
VGPQGIYTRGGTVSDVSQPESEEVTPAGRSIRSQLGMLLAILGAFVVGLLVVTTLQLRAAGVQTRAETQRHHSFRLADSMRKSSNDLTLMVRLYVSTSDPRYRDYYDEILAIRSGTAPRPLNYDSSFWDRVLAEGKDSVEYGEPEALVAQMRAANFTDDEFDALNASLQASNDLARLELEVMDRVERRIARGVDETYFADVTPEYLRLVDRSYLAQKGVIMSAIDDFIRRVEARTERAVDEARADVRALTVFQLVILGLIVIAGTVAMARLRRTLLRPLEQLAVATDHFATGSYQERVSVSGVSELEDLAFAFNHMASAVESDVTRREVAERDAMEARLAAEEANRAKSAFVAAMSHEIRTPMIGVTGMLEVLAQTGLNAEQQSMVSTAQGSAQVLLQIIGDILDFSKIEAGKLELAPAPFMADRLAEAAVQTFFHTASAKGLRISCTIEDGVAAAHVGDALRIRQVLTNFVSNAVKFTSEGGIALKVGALDEAGTTQTLEFSVTDTGVGVSPDRQRELFQEYVQAEVTTAAAAGGSGLGLVICRRLAELMDGDVRMESLAGQGTTMYLTVRLPVADAQDVEPAMSNELGGGALVRSRPKPSREVAQQEGSLLLLAEDHPINQRVLTHQLGMIGFHVDVADDGRKALELFLRGRYGLVLTDLNMPDMDGYELARAIRRHEAETGRAPIPIIAMSANVLAGEADKCADAGMDGFLAKPSPMGALARTLYQWLPHLEWPSTGPAAETRAPDSGDRVVDFSALDELTGGDAALAASILADYVESSGSDFAALHAALDAASADDVRRTAHRVKGASRVVGASQVASVAARLEEAASDTVEDWDTLRSALDELEAAFGQVAAAVENGARYPSR